MNINDLAADLSALTHIVRNSDSDDKPCWVLVRYLYRVGRDTELAANLSKNAAHLYEAWYRTSVVRGMVASVPWDIWALKVRKPYVDHVAIVVNHTHLIHATDDGAYMVEGKRWEHKLIAIYRPRPQHAFAS